MAKERLLRDWTDSESIDSLSPEAERFFTRLIMKADDYGSFHSNTKLLKSNLFPLRDDLKDKRIEEWMKELLDAGLIFLYNVKGKHLLRIINFGQRLRNKRNIFPPPSDSQQVAAIENDSQQVAIEVEEEREDEQETEEETNSDPTVMLWPSFQDFWDLYDKKNDLSKCESKWKKINQGAREKIMHHLALYVRATPDKAFRKNPITYLNNESWNDEIITRQHNGQGKSAHDSKSRIDEIIQNRHGSG